MRVRRTSDNTEIDVTTDTINHISDSLTKTVYAFNRLVVLNATRQLLGTWLDGSIGRVVRWTNQRFTDASVIAVGTNVWPKESGNVANSTIADQPNITADTPFPTFLNEVDRSSGLPGNLFVREIQDFELPGVFTFRM